MSNTPLTKVDKYCYLGVYLQNKISWTSHIDYVSHKANHLLGFLKRSILIGRYCFVINTKDVVKPW